MPRPIAPQSGEGHVQGARKVPHVVHPFSPWPHPVHRMTVSRRVRSLCFETSVQRVVSTRFFCACTKRLIIGAENSPTPACVYTPRSRRL